MKKSLFLYLFIKASGKEGIESNFEESNKKYEYGEWLLKSSSQHDEHSNETFTKEADEMVVNYLQKRNEHFESLYPRQHLRPSGECR